MRDIHRWGRPHALADQRVFIQSVSVVIISALVVIPSSQAELRTSQMKWYRVPNFMCQGVWVSMGHHGISDFFVRLARWGFHEGRWDGFVLDIRRQIPGMFCIYMCV